MPGANASSILRCVGPWKGGVRGVRGDGVLWCIYGVRCWADSILGVLCVWVVLSLYVSSLLCVSVVRSFYTCHLYNWVEPISLLFINCCRWLCGDVIGEGAFGTVHMGLNLETGELMAVKSISLDQGELTSADAKAFENEIAILRDNKWVWFCFALLCFASRAML